MGPAPRISPVEQEILELLLGQAMFGLEMVRASKSLKRGTIYVTLNRMEEKGYVTSHHHDDRSQPGMPRRRYAISAIGKRALEVAAAAAVAWSASVEGA